MSDQSVLSGFTGELAKNRGGRPAWRPTAEQRDLVTTLSGCGVAHPTIARLVGCSPPTLKKACRDELRHGFEDLKARLSAALVRQALNGHVGAIKYWLATRCPEWRIPKDQVALFGDEANDNDNDEPWVIMMPPNGRDQPERDDDEPPLIEGDAEDA